MKYLMDSCVLLWLIMKSDRISPQAREIIENPKIDVFASTVSLWELSLKHSLGKLPLQEVDIEDFLEVLHESGLGIIGLNEHESSSFHRLPRFGNHRDPFDRMLIWQAITRGMTLISSDEDFERYRSCGLRLLW
ncbi:MAG: type II toxin-antitoxin system VapC family toxin [Coriobacteriia bacterium]|nr:type II toxin-antitoxin system VapC family toxin [Coriobacteriia bacterium]